MSYSIAYLQWYLKSQRKKIMMYLGLLAVIIALPMWVIGTEDQHGVLIALAYITLALDTLAALTVPVLQFRFLMDQRANDLYLPLPIKRRQMFFMQFGIGSLLLVLPNLMYMLAITGNPAARSYWKGYVFLMIMLMFFTFVEYSINTFLVLQCHNLTDAIVAMVGFVLAQFLVIATIDSLLSNTVNAVLDSGGAAYEFFPDWLNLLLSPIYSGVRSINAVDDMVSREFMLHGFGIWQEYSGIHLLLITVDAIVAVIAVYFAKHSYEVRKGENSEQKTTSKWIYPLLITLVSGCLIFENILSPHYFIFTVIIYFIMNFVAQRKIAVHLRMVVRFAGLMIAALVISRLLIDTKGFGLIHDAYERDEFRQIRVEISFIGQEYQVPEALQETTGFISTDYLGMTELQDDEWLLDHVYDLRNQIKNNNEYSETTAAFINIVYELSNQKVIYRHYTVEQAYLDEVKEIGDYMLEHHYADLGMYR